ncbi:zf-TFIIB domain-containing protein [Patescibacteria group bacterium]|nr:zf-TFIIB domain-containing protein [Patescibacteria group bacterium]
MSLSCPRCKSTLTQVKVKSHYGREDIIVDQCEGCQGIWFDPSEYYKIDKGDVEKMDSVKDLEAKIDTIISEIPKCPKDGADLVRFLDISIPKNMDIEICPVCGGYWFDKGELVELRKTAWETNPAYTEEFHGNIDEILASYSKKDKYDRISSISDILMQPYGGNNEKANMYFDSAELLPQALYAILRAVLKI